MKVLVHFDSTGHVAHGLWWIGEDGNPTSLYKDQKSPEAVRGSLLVYSRQNPKVSWEAWFDNLTARHPYFENWATYDSMGFTPEQMLSAMDDTQLAV